MRRDAEITAILNDVLTAELTSVNQYFVDAKMMENWGYDPLAQHFRDGSLRDDQNLEISVVNALGREIHREFVHRRDLWQS